MFVNNSEVTAVRTTLRDLSTYISLVGNGKSLGGSLPTCRTLCHETLHNFEGGEENLEKKLPRTLLSMFGEGKVRQDGEGFQRPSHTR